MPVNFKNGSIPQASPGGRRAVSTSGYPKFSGSGHIHHSSPSLLRSFSNGASPRRSNTPRFFGLKRQPRRTPRPELTKAAFLNVATALRCGIDIYQAELVKHKETISGSSRLSRAAFYYGADKQIKTLERMIRTLESHRDKVEVLQDGYMLRCKLREGADNLATALASHSSRQSKSKLLELKAERKEVVEQICKIEDSLDQLMGVFYVKVVGLVGFARLCSGDVFEAKLQMGQQKWKSKCKVQKSEQQWQDSEVVFASQFNSELSVKLVESRTFQGHVQIGSVRCSTKDLMTIQPQRVTLVLKGASSLRLAVICCWSPWMESESVVLDMPESELVLGHVQGSDMAIPLSTFGDASSDRPMSGDWTSSRDETDRALVASPRRILVPVHEHTVREEKQAVSLAVAYGSLTNAFERYRGEYSELAEFEKLLDDIREVLQYERRSLKKQNSMTLSETSALDQFEFLEKVSFDGAADGDVEDADRTPGSPTCRLHISNRESLDSGKGHSVSSASSGHSPSLVKRLSSNVFPVEKKSETLTTGNELLDKALVHHLCQCSRHVQHLNSFGPLRFKEITAVNKLVRQTDIIHQLSLLVAASGCPLTVDEVMPEMNDNEELVTLWLQCCGSNALFVDVNDLVTALDSQFGASLWANYMAVANNVFPCIVNLIHGHSSDDMDGEPSAQIVTVYEYYDYFSRMARKGLTEYVFRFAKDMLVVDGLLSKERDDQEQALDSLYGFGFSERIVYTSCSLLARNDPHTTAIIAEYVERVAQYPVHRAKVLNILLYSLENTDQHIRQGACIALGVLQAKEAISELAYLAKCDFVTVKEAARQALLTCGDDGQMAMLHSMPTTFTDLGPVHTLVPQEVL